MQISNIMSCRPKWLKFSEKLMSEIQIGRPTGHMYQVAWPHVSTKYLHYLGLLCNSLSPRQTNSFPHIHSFICLLNSLPAFFIHTHFLHWKFQLLSNKLTHSIIPNLLLFPQPVTHLLAQSHLGLPLFWFSCPVVLFLKSLSIWWLIGAVTSVTR